MATHNWIASTLGHGEAMCSKCFITNREAAVLGELHHCPKEDAPVPVRRQAGSEAAVAHPASKGDSDHG